MKSGKNSLGKSSILTCLLVVGMFGLCVQRAEAVPEIKTTWSEPNTITFEIIGQPLRNDLEIEIDFEDNGNDFESHTAGWTNGGYRTISSTRKAVIFNRNGSTSGDETVIVKDKNNKPGRGKDGSIFLTLNGAVVSTRGSQDTFRTTSYYFDIPTVSQWGLIVMALLLLTAGTIVIVRRKRRVAA